MRIQKPLASRSELSDSCQLLLQASWNTVMAKVGLPHRPGGYDQCGVISGRQARDRSSVGYELRSGV